MSEIEKILEEEGFRSKPYPDPIHGWDVPTFGHGLTYITEAQSKQIAMEHYQGKWDQLIVFDWFFNLPEEAQNIVAHMAYQMGVGGVLGFEQMIKALKEKDFEKAADEMLDSEWARDTSARAQRLSTRMRALVNAEPEKKKIWVALDEHGFVITFTNKKRKMADQGGSTFLEIQTVNGEVYTVSNIQKSDALA